MTANDELGRKHSWTVVRYYPSISMKGMKYKMIQSI